MSNEDKHTPGPWTWINSNLAEGRLGRLFGNGDLVVDCNTVDGFIYGSPKDAHLIAAAPDLLEALEDLTKRCIQSGLENIDFPVGPALAAIAKAKGEDQ